MQATCVHIQSIADDQFLVFTFPDVLSKKAAEKAIAEWDTHFDQRPTQVDLVWDCKEMCDYEPMARILWQKAMSRHKVQIGMIYLISESQVIRAAAKLLALFVKIHIKPVRSWTDVPVQEAVTA